MVVTSYPISWERCLVLQMTAIKDCDFSVQASLTCWQSLKVINFQHPYSPVTLLFPNVTHPSFHSITPLPNIYTPLTLSPILQPSLQTEGLPIFTQPLVVVIQLVVCWGHLSPLIDTKYAIGVVPILSYSMQLNWIFPILCQKFIWKADNDFGPFFVKPQWDQESCHGLPVPLPGSVRVWPAVQELPQDGNSSFSCGPVKEYGSHQEFPWVVVQAFLDQVEWGLGWGPLDISV